MWRGYQASLTTDLVEPFEYTVVYPPLLVPDLQVIAFRASQTAHVGAPPYKIFVEFEEPVPVPITHYDSASTGARFVWDGMATSYVKPTFPTVPDAPNAPTLIGAGTSAKGSHYIEVIVPTMPPRGDLLSLLSRVVGKTEWSVVSQIAEGGGMLRVDGGKGGVTYEVAWQARNGAGPGPVSPLLIYNAPSDEPMPILSDALIEALTKAIYRYEPLRAAIRHAVR